MNSALGWGRKILQLNSALGWDGNIVPVQLNSAPGWDRKIIRLTKISDYVIIYEKSPSSACHGFGPDLDCRQLN